MEDLSKDLLGYIQIHENWIDPPPWFKGPDHDHLAI
jgi:hypothetical protein